MVTQLDRPLGVVDVGCRWGFAEVWEQLAGSARLVGFDPDPEECERLRERYAERPEIEVVDWALAERRGARTVHLTAEPACSSFFPPDPMVLAQIADLSIMRPLGTTQTEARTLDEWQAESGWGPVDFLKADVQGAEREVLQGAGNALGYTVVMELEVEFNPLYEGQALFADVDELARSLGFRLWRLSNMAHYTRGPGDHHRAIPDVHYCDSRPVHWESPGGQLFWAHALYVAADVVERSSEDWQRPLRAGCLAATLGLPDLALHAWSAAADLAPAGLAEGLAAAIGSYAS